MGRSSHGGYNTVMVGYVYIDTVVLNTSKAWTRLSPQRLNAYDYWSLTQLTGYTALKLILSAVHLHCTIVISSIIIPYWSLSLKTASFFTFIYHTNTKPCTVNPKHIHCTMHSHIIYITLSMNKFGSLTSTRSLCFMTKELIQTYKLKF